MGSEPGNSGVETVRRSSTQRANPFMDKQSFVPDVAPGDEEPIELTALCLIVCQMYGCRHRATHVLEERHAIEGFYCLECGKRRANTVRLNLARAASRLG